MADVTVMGRGQVVARSWHHGTACIEASRWVGLNCLFRALRGLSSSPGHGDLTKILVSLDFSRQMRERVACDFVAPFLVTARTVF